MRKLSVVIAIAIGLGLVAQAAGSTASDIRPPTAKVEGATLTKLTKRFFFFDGAIPVVDGSHPSLDVGAVDCSIGQSSKKLWFLAGVFDLDSDLEKSCVVPKSATLYVPIISWVCSPELFDGEDLDECLADGLELNALLDLSLTVDGVTLDTEALAAYQVQTGGFDLPLVEDSIWEYTLGLELGDSISFGTDAFAALVGPLSVGEHEIVVTYRSEEFGFEGSLTYHLTAAPLKK